MYIMLLAYIVEKGLRDFRIYIVVESIDRLEVKKIEKKELSIETYNLLVEVAKDSELTNLELLELALIELESLKTSSIERKRVATSNIYNYIVVVRDSIERE